MGGAVGKPECTICLIEFTRPKILPCFHTFCEDCLGQYIKEHAHFNKFNCPMCRRTTEVPGDGASCFTDNVYLDAPDPTQKHYCTKHKEKEIEFYCFECCHAACAKCIIVNHKTHTVVDITEVDQEYRKKVTSSKEILEKTIQKRQTQKELLQLNVASIMTSAATACNNIDVQVENIYTEAKNLGENCKGDVDQLRDVEIKKLQKLLDYEDSLISQLQTAVDYSRTSLTGTCTKFLIDISPNIDTLSKERKDLSIYVPVVKHPYMPLVKINTNILKQQLGELQTLDESTFTTMFDLKEIKDQDAYYYSHGYRIQGLPWCVGVRHATYPSSFDIGLWLNTGGDKTVKACTVDRTIKLLHQIDDSKSVVKKDTGVARGVVYKPGGQGWGWKSLIDWKKLTDPTNGFLLNNRCTVQTTLKITNIDR